ncbi:SDR family oxidoreductase [Desulfuromonas thiophila]|uniref:SDR family oxidoreductase n=1 Tax=Desulfuromonas thiophila TaxID=57664 RepID=UPI0024A902EF|nr:SDR family oxidoreductase [Desulfuromonas thiophila]
MKCYFITGASGAIGSALIPLLLADPDTRIVLLLRANDAANLASRLTQLLHYWTGQDQPLAQISALRGDVGQPRFGLSETDYQQLCRDCSHIVHCAGMVRMNLPLDEARQTAVGATKHLLKMANQCPRLQKIEFVSTVGVGGRRREPLVEDWVHQPRSFHNSYEQAKAEAEELLVAPVASGLPLTLHRPSMVVGDSRNGRIIHFQVFYHLCEFLSGSRTFGVVPAIPDATLDLIPVDLVARALLWSSQQTTTQGAILHLCSGPRHALPIDQLTQQIHQLFRQRRGHQPPLRQVPLGLFKAGLPLLRLLSPARTRRAIDTLPVFFDYLNEPQQFANDQTRHILHQAGIPIPPVRQYLAPVIRYYLEQHG